MNTTVRIQSASGLENASLTASAKPPWKLDIASASLGTQSFVSEDLFDALIELRKLLEARGEKLLVAGARRDVYPSSMSREMGGGRKGYIHRIGLPATEAVDIFAPANLEDVGTVEEQKEFRRRWVEALGKTPPPGGGAPPPKEPPKWGFVA